jgi:putative copper resistance protein D
MAEALAVVRFFHFLAAMAAFGIGAFGVYALAGAIPSSDAPARTALDAGLARAMTAAAVATLLSALAIVPFTAAEMTGSAKAALDLATAHAVLADTGFGHAWCLRLGFGAATVLCCLVPRGRRQQAAATLGALATLASLGWVGHAATAGGGGIARTVNQMLHLSAAGLWLGGLVPLGILLARARRDAAYARLAAAALPQFSQMGYAAVALIALTGAVNSALLVGSLGAFAATGYGRLLAVKIVLFAAMVGLALVNRFRLTPRLRAPEAAPSSLRALYRSVLGEQALGLAILAVVAVLGTWAPAIEMTHHH